MQSFAACNLFRQPFDQRFGLMEILLGDEADSGVQIPARQGDRHRADAAARDVDGPRVVASGHRLFCLAGDAGFLCRVERHLVICAVVDGAAVHKGEDRPAPDMADLLVLRDTCDVGGGGAFHHDGGVGQNRYTNYKSII